MKEKTYKWLSNPNNDLYQSQKICLSKKVLKTTTSTSNPPPPHPPPSTPPSSKVEGIFAPKKSPGYGCYLQLNLPIQQIE